VDHQSGTDQGSSAHKRGAHSHLISKFHVVSPSNSGAFNQFDFGSSRRLFQPYPDEERGSTQCPEGLIGVPLDRVSKQLPLSRFLHLSVHVRRREKVPICFPERRR
jgi:hypothetical protein